VTKDESGEGAGEVTLQRGRPAGGWRDLGWDCRRAGTPAPLPDAGELGERWRSSCPAPRWVSGGRTGAAEPGSSPSVESE